MTGFKEKKKHVLGLLSRKTGSGVVVEYLRSW